ncbi:hypothetical protein [Streptomyces sp. NPDC046197]|uniref:P-type ATPase n=1 Tax=Streptomyces sp. NPDC046197 TaxID=3154337 RepID=UPI0033E4E7AF
MQVVVGDVVLLAAGDEVPADGRIVAASALQIDESALTGESVPAAKDSRTLTGADLPPGGRTNMAFMNTPVTHGSATVIVTATGAGTELGRISGMLSPPGEASPLTQELDRLTLWITGTAGLTMIVMFVLGRSRGTAWDALFVSAVSPAIAAIPEALPTVTQRDGDGPDHRRLRQQADEPGDARRVRPRGAGHPDGCLPQAARHDPAESGAARVDAGPRARAAGAVGARRVPGPLERGAGRTGPRRCDGAGRAAYGGVRVRGTAAYEYGVRRRTSTGYGGGRRTPMSSRRSAARRQIRL